MAAGASGGASRPSMGASEHIDADNIDLAELEAQSRQEDYFEIPEGAIAFNPIPAEIAEVGCEIR